MLYIFLYPKVKKPYRRGQSNLLTVAFGKRIRAFDTKIQPNLTHKDHYAAGNNVAGTVGNMIMVRERMN